MKLDAKTNNYATNAVSHGKFKVANNAVMQQILSSFLYSDKIQSVIREVSMNGVESHMVAGCPDKPIEVTLPTWQNLQFSVRDYGTGLSKDALENLYCTYGISTKRDSDEFTGGFGIGSKSPFAYTDMFFVTSYYNGVKYTVCNSKNSFGEFVFDILSEVETDEPNGVEVTFDVQKSDVTSFVDKATNLYSWFNVAPKTNVKLNLIQRKPIEKGDGWELLKYKDYYYSSSRNYVVMGQVAYEIDSEHFKGNAKSVLQACDMILYVDIGEISIAPSRENLQYNHHTINKLTEILEKFYVYIKQKAQDAVKNCQSKWEARILAKEYYHDNSFLGKLIGNQITFNGTNISVVTELPGQSFDVIKYEWDKYDNCVNEYRKHVRIKVDKNTQFALYEKGGYAASRRFIENNHDAKLYVFPSDKKDYLVDEIGVLESDILYTSNFPAHVRQAKAKSVKNIVQAYKLVKASRNYSNRSYWVNHQIDIDSETGYYCPIKNFIIEDKVAPYELDAIISNQNVIGILDARKEKFENHTNWKHIRELLKEKLDDLVNNIHVKKFGNVKDADNKLRTLVRYKDKILNKNSDIYKLLLQIEEYDTHKGEVASFVTLNKLYVSLGGKDYSLNSSYINLSFDLISRFPMLSYVNSWQMDDDKVLNYINQLNK